MKLRPELGEEAATQMSEGGEFSTRGKDSSTLHPSKQDLGVFEELKESQCGCRVVERRRGA